MSTSASTLWPLSVVASILAAVGYAPEFRRLWTERHRGSVGVALWAIWTTSSGLSLANALACEASPLVVANVAVIFVLSTAVAACNLALPTAETASAAAAVAPEEQRC